MRSKLIDKVVLRSVVTALVGVLLATALWLLFPTWETSELSRHGSGRKHTGYVEIWEADYDSPVEFTAKPKKTTYFKKGRTLTVRRIDGEGA